MKRTSKLTLAVATVLLACVLFPSTGSADTYPNVGWVADSSAHDYCFYTVASGNRQPYHDAMSYLASNTDMTTVYKSSCNFDTTDVIFGEGYADGNRGQAFCINYLAGNACDSAAAQVDPSVIFSNVYDHGGNGLNFTYNKVKTLRHELGHTIGLNNDGVSWSSAPTYWADAQVSGWVPTSLTWVVWSDHHLAHINSYF